LLETTQDQPPPPPPLNTHAEATVSIIPSWTVFVCTPEHTMPKGQPLGMPFSFGEVLCRHVSEVPQNAIHIAPPSAVYPQATMTFAAPLVHAIPKTTDTSNIQRV
jgi:hypothetical protein